MTVRLPAMGQDDLQAVFAAIESLKARGERFESTDYQRFMFACSCSRGNGDQIADTFAAELDRLNMQAPPDIIDELRQKTTVQPMVELPPIDGATYSPEALCAIQELLKSIVSCLAFLVDERDFLNIQAWVGTESDPGLIIEQMLKISNETVLPHVPAPQTGPSMIDLTS